ncbi:MAG: L-seryl-tRNA(Sec) selenium transferase [Deltaproteobacteria bacterium]|jgi:L-seryl-tRNA(Ser) seleniumtransferase|nr:L-seryl-tRNA(Sec) selenium transferase [Deltaproteobacteria bacterium]
MPAQATILKLIPQVEKVLNLSSNDADLKAIPRSALTLFVRQALEELRQGALKGELTQIPANSKILSRVKEIAAEANRVSLREIINATGIVLHTNLGRAPLAQTAIESMVDAAKGYCALEYDLQQASRRDRHKSVEDLLVELTGAPAATIVNNNAAALFLLALVLAGGRSAVISRGELVEIGGSFRLSEIIKAAGVQLKEVGSTNRTLIKDYRSAIEEDPEEIGLVLKVHCSNFRLIGYVAQTPVNELSSLAKDKGLPLAVDLGSGSLIDLSARGLEGEETVSSIVSQGADVVCFSGDKLLGAAQGGLIVGREDIIKKIKTHPLARTMRPDKTTLAATEATLKLYRTPKEALKLIPILRMLNLTDQELRQLALKLKATIGRIKGLKTSIVRVNSQAGGGAAPERPLSSWAVSVESDNGVISALVHLLRLEPVSVVARVVSDRLLFDVRTIFPSQFKLLKLSLARAWSKLSSEIKI